MRRQHTQPRAAGGAQGRPAGCLPWLCLPALGGAPPVGSAVAVTCLYRTRKRTNSEVSTSLGSPCFAAHLRLHPACRGQGQGGSAHAMVGAAAAQWTQSFICHSAHVQTTALICVGVCHPEACMKVAAPNVHAATPNVRACLHAPQKLHLHSSVHSSSLGPVLHFCQPIQSLNTPSHTLNTLFYTCDPHCSHPLT